MELLLELARCPRTGQELEWADGRLITADGRWSYRVENGIPVLLPIEAEEVKL
jgi:uncharacterized protein YbaR (Trm112 family)